MSLRKPVRISCGNGLFRRVLPWAAGVTLLCAVGCRNGWFYRAPTTPMPANTELLSSLMSRLSEQPGFTQGILDRLNHGGRNGAALMTPKLVDRLRRLILGKHWEGLDRFPGWTMGQITPTVDVAGTLLARQSRTGDVDADENANFSRQPAAEEIQHYLNTGEWPLRTAVEVNLDEPATGGGSAGSVQELGYGVRMGDGPDPKLIGEHAESARLAELLNRMSVNGMALDGPVNVQTVSAKLGQTRAQSPEELMRALTETGHTVRVFDARYFANFGHLHDGEREVMMPFWVDTRIVVPGTARVLLVPVSHAEYEWQIRGPRVNADVAYYYGIDGHAEWRTMDELNQAWVLGRHAHVYQGEQAMEVTRLVSRFVVAYMHQHTARPKLPFGGYYTLGVCQDTVSAIEKRVTGKTTLFPNTADARLFDDPRDAEVNSLIASIPKDRDGGSPEPERVFGSLPTEQYEQITIPGLAEDVSRAHAAWLEGRLVRLPRRRHAVLVAGLELLGVAAAIGLVVFLRRRR